MPNCSPRFAQFSKILFFFINRIVAVTAAAVVGVGVVGVSVPEHAAALQDGLYDRVARDGRTHRGVAARKGLRRGNDVRLNAPVLHAEGLARPTHAGHDLVGDQQDVVARADLPDHPPIALGRDAGPDGGPHDGLRDERGHVLFPDAPDLPIQELGIVTSLLLLRGVAQLTAVAVGGLDLRALPEQGRVRSAAAHIARKPHRPQS